MLVYGDRSRVCDPRAVVEALRSGVAGLTRVPAGVQRHAALVSLFIEASGLAQGLADAAAEASGADSRTPEQDRAMALVLDLAVGVIRSWRSSFATTAPPELRLLDAIQALGLPERVSLRQAEGYAFYALYPEAYAQAARALAPAPDMTVIGVRSIGSGLSAVVAASLGSAPPITLRPIGHPFQRRIALSAELRAALLDQSAGRFAIVDEGPGLSGSSFGAVADLLETGGVAPDRIVAFPSHAGDPGAQASARHLDRWRRMDRRVGDLAQLAAGRTEGELVADWVADLTGPATAPIQDVSGGAWRAVRYADEVDWPPVDTFQERRKFLITTASGVWLAKFAGLGWEGQRKSERAEVLAQAGLTPEVAGWRHGFQVERWRDDAKPLNPERLDRDQAIVRLARYLSLRARRLPALDASGASPAELLQMMRVNAGEGLGADAASRFVHWEGRLDRLQAQAHPIRTDNRLQTFEWMTLPDGRWLKADASDHADTHDLIGAQDIAWDLAGAIVEFELDGSEQDRLRDAIATGLERRIAPEAVAFYIDAYLAFQLGAYTMSAQSHGHWPAEAARLGRARDSYAAKLAWRAFRT